CRPVPRAARRVDTSFIDLQRFRPRIARGSGLTRAVVQEVGSLAKAARILGVSVSRMAGGQMSFPIPANEPERLAAVRSLNILDTAPDIGYDEIGELAAQICQCPVAYVSFMDDDRLWLKAKYGLPPDFHQCPREIAFCTETICGTELVVAPDLR